MTTETRTALLSLLIATLLTTALGVAAGRCPRRVVAPVRGSWAR